MSKHCFLRRHPGEGAPMILAIVLVLLMLFCTVAEFSRVWIIAQGVKLSLIHISEPTDKRQSRMPSSA